MPERTSLAPAAYLKEGEVLAEPTSTQLTPREIEVLKLIAAGLSTKQIAVSLGVAFKTAACHRSRIMDKLGIHEVANLTRYAIRKEYVQAGNGTSGQTQEELFEQVRVTHIGYQKALNEYSAFIRDRESIGLQNPDSSTGARRLREGERAAHEEYHNALMALKRFLIRD